MPSLKARPPKKPVRPATRRYNAERVEIGPAETMDAALESMATAAALSLTAIDFQARQDAIGTKRKGPGEKHKIKIRTRAKPTDVPETEII